MDRGSIIQVVGEDRYNAASAELRRLACSADFGLNRAPSAPDLPHEASDYIWDAPLSADAKIVLFFTIYDDLPSYGMLMYAKHQYADWSATNRAEWWRQVRARLNGPAAAPLTYALWCDWFEDQNTVDDAWQALTADRNDALLRRVLPVSGAVPWEVKHPLLLYGADSLELRDVVIEALLGASFDVFGDVETAEALALLKRLSVSEDDPRYQQLVARLAG
jgi:hypothetical protein